MAKSGQAGFTLIEITLVIAITGLMLMAVLFGQRSLRARFQFDAAVERFVSSVAEARTEATAGVNIVGAGDGTAGGNCPSGGSGDYVFAGTDWKADSQAGGAATITVTSYKAEIDGDKNLTGVACSFDSRTLSLPSPVKVNVANVAAQRGYQVMYVRDSRGGLNVCGTTDMVTAVAGAFGGGACTAPSGGSNTLTLTDDDGHTSQILMDDSGIAKRNN